MAVKLLCLCLLLALLCPSRAKKPKCPTSASSCDECIRSGPECAWCAAPHSNTGCHSLKGLQRAGCHTNYVYYPQGTVRVVKNDSSTDAEALFLRPQEVSLRLRPGVSQSFPLTITMATGQPVPELIVDAIDVPAGVNITFSRIATANPLLIQVSVEAAQCPSESDDSNQNRTGPWSVHITPRGFSLSVELEITLECQCDCTGNREEKSPTCSGHGALVCGHCQCHQPYFGQRCQMSIEPFSSPSEENCQLGPNAPVCSGRGRCVAGACECQERRNPKERYSGKFCECSNFDCPYHDNKLCGGHGKCECGRCLCDDDWTGTDCRCSLETASCMATNQQLCNGRGRCECGACKCWPPYSGPTCEDCPSCLNTCQRHRDCVECQAFGVGVEDRCDHACGPLGVTVVESTDALPQGGERVSLCKMRSREDSCWFYYTISNTPSGQQSTVARAKDCAL